MRGLSPLILIAANAVPLLGVFLWNWDAAAMVVFYWSENLIIGALTLVKILHKSPILGWFAGAFFTIHYGGFCAVHGMIALALFDVDIGDPFEGAGWPFFLIFIELLIGVTRGVLRAAPPDWLWAFLAIAVSHTISLAVNYFGQREYENTTTQKLMTAPYRRIIVLHLAVLFGGFGVVALKSPVPLLLLLVVGKTILDLHLHLREHNLQWTSLFPKAAGVLQVGSGSH